VSWGYYVVAGTEPDCRNDAAISCAPIKQAADTPGIWNPLPYFDTVRQDGELKNIQSVDNFYKSAGDGSLPAVSWVVPSGPVSEHPPGTLSAGQAYVTSLVNAVMNGPDWNSTAIFLAWDDWGGFYDHVTPPTVDTNGYGLRVPGLVISAYAKQGFIDHQTLSFDAYSKFIEDDFLGGARLDPITDGRPDPRPDVRENAPQLGDLTNDFDFTQSPRPPTPLPVHPPPGPASQ
jgi:phospholipase C